MKKAVSITIVGFAIVVLIIIALFIMMVFTGPRQVINKPLEGTYPELINNSFQEKVYLEFGQEEYPGTLIRQQGKYYCDDNIPETITYYEEYIDRGAPISIINILDCGNEYYVNLRTNPGIPPLYGPFPKE